LHKVIQGSRQSQTISDDESFLVIFGFESDFSWDGYVYKQDNWKREATDAISNQPADP